MFPVGWRRFLSRTSRPIRRHVRAATSPRVRCRPELHLLEDRTLLSVVPQIIDARVSAPDPTTILVRHPIYYTSGKLLDVSLTLPTGIGVSELRVGAAAIPKAGMIDPIDGTSTYYELRSDWVLTRSEHRLGVRLHFSNPGDGTSNPVRVIVANLLGGAVERTVPATAEYDFTFATVKEVNGAPAISIAEAELRNQLILGLFNKFGDTGRFVTDDGHEFYDPSYDIDLRIRPDGIHFGMSMKYNLPYYCDPKARVEGVFTLERTADGKLQAHWLDGPNVVDLDFSDEGLEEIYCDVPATVVDSVIGTFTLTFADLASVVTYFVRDKIASAIDDQIASVVSGLGCSGLDCLDFVPTGPLGTFAHELRVPLILPFPGITIQVPYNIDSTEHPLISGLALNPLDQVIVTSAGLSDVAKMNVGAPPGGASLPVGPNGLFNYNTSIPEPLATLGDPTSGAIYPQRIEAQSALDTLRRCIQRSSGPCSLPLYR